MADDGLIEQLIGELASSPDAADRLASAVSEAMAQSIRRDALPRRTDLPRVLSGGADVKTIPDGTTIWDGPSRFPVLDFRGGSLSIASRTNRDTVQINMGAGADCLFDYLVSSCWATEVAAGRGAEGQTFTTASGCTYKMYSTLTLMETALEAAGVAATVAICGGTYAETWTINGTTLSGKRVSYFGASSAKVLVSALAFASGSFTDTKGLTIKEIGVTSVDLTGCDSTWFEDCILSAMTISVASSTIRDVHFKNCEIGAVTGANNVQWATCSFENCAISSLVFSTGSCNLGPIRIESCTVGGIDQGTGGVGTDVQILDCAISGSVNGGANVMRLTQCDGLIISNCAIAGGVSGATIQLCETVGRAWGFDISGNRFGSNTNGYVGTSAANKEATRGFFGANVFSTDGGAAVKAAHATANFGYVTFGPNGPDIMDYSSVVTTSGGNAYYTGGTVPAGAVPVGAALVTKDDGSTIVAVTQSLDFRSGLSAVLNGTTEGQIALGNLTAAWTQAGVFDISTAGNLTVLKHLAVGSTSAIQTTEIVDVTETIASKVAKGIFVALTVSAAGAGGVAGALAFGATLSATSGTQPQFGGMFGTGTHGGGGATISDLFAINAGLVSTAGTGAITRAMGLWVPAASWGAGVIPVTTHVLRAEDQGNASTTTPYGLKIAAQTGTNPRSFIADALVLGGSDRVKTAQLDLAGDVRLDGVAASGTPAADDLVVYNETATGFLKVKDPAALVYNLTHQHLTNAQVDVTVASTTVPYQVFGPMPHAGVIVGVYAKLGENKTNGATSSIFDVHKILAANQDTDGQGTTIYTTQGNRPTIANTHMATTATAPDVTAFAAGDWFAMYTDQAGTTATVATVALTVRYT